jgi:RHS repeat-associated protein
MAARGELIVSGACPERSRRAGTVDYLYDLEGHQVSEVSAAGAWNRGEVYVGGRHLATYSGGASGATYFIHADWLGTERARSTVAGAVCETIKSLPFGDGLATSGSCGDPSPLHFTGKQHDAETNLDDFDARYYSSGLARFMIPDWAAKATAVPYAEFGDPQSLNLYSYVRNNPVTAVDADGHETQTTMYRQACEDCGSFWSPENADNPAGYESGASEGYGWINGVYYPPQQRIADTANKYNGSTAWAFTAQKGAFACNTNKCNAFVGDVTKEAGAPVSVTGSDGKSRYPLAAELADKRTKIANWRVLGPGEKAQLGDIAAYKLPGGGASYSGHSGIVTSVDRDGTVHAMAAHATVVGPDNKFNPGVGAAVITYRRFTGDR